MKVKNFPPQKILIIMGISRDNSTDLLICHGSATDLRRSATVTQGEVCRWPFDCVFNPQTLSVSIRSRSVRSGYVLANICWHGGVTRTTRMGIRTIRTLTDELRILRSIKTLRKNQKQVDFSEMAYGSYRIFGMPPTDCSMPLRISQGYYGCYGRPYGWKI